MNTPNSLPVRIRKTFEDAGFDFTLKTHANFRYTFYSPVNHEIELTPNEQLSRFQEIIIRTIGEMPESFMMMNKWIDEDDDSLAVKFRAVGYSANNEATVGHSPKGDKVEQFITNTLNSAKTYFGAEVSDSIATILNAANETRKQQEVIETLAPTFGNAVAARMAQLLKQVLAEEEAKGISSEDSAVIPGVAAALLGVAGNSSTNSTSTDDAVDTNDVPSTDDDDALTLDGLPITIDDTSTGTPDEVNNESNNEVIVPTPKRKRTK